MNVTGAAVVWLLVGFVLATWPFLTERRFLVFSRPGEKGFGVRVLELLLGYALMLLAGFGLENSMSAIQSQTWNFYAMTALLYVLLAYPGFVWRYLRKRSGADRSAKGQEA